MIAELRRNADFSSAIDIVSKFIQQRMFPTLNGSSMRDSSQTRSLLDMLKINGVAFYAASSALMQTWGVVSIAQKQADSRIDDSTAKKIASSVRRFHTNVMEMGAEITAMAAVDLVKTLETSNPGMKFSDLGESLNVIDATLTRELSLVRLFVIERDKSRYFEPEEPPFGTDLQNKFPSLIYDMEEASNCLALGRSTASAFHSLRCLEAGIRAISRCLGIPDPTTGQARNWRIMLEGVQKQINSRWPNSGDRFSGDGHFFESIHAGLVAMQNPYRNATMHLDQKYTEDEAKHIFELVGGLMKKIASRMDEAGKPLA